MKDLRHLRSIWLIYCIASYLRRNALIAGMALSYNT